MKQSEFSYLIAQSNFKIGFRGALSLIIAEIIDANTSEGVDITSIDYFEFKRREFAYSLKGADGSMDRYVHDLRPLFPAAESTEPYFPFTLTEDVQQKNGVCDIDEVETQLYLRIKAGGFFNYWAKALPEDKGKMYDVNTKQWS